MFTQLFIILFLHQTTTSDVNPFQQGKLFIILFLHQTTTLLTIVFIKICCLSSCSYIKPQPSLEKYDTNIRCLSSCSYIKPQPRVSARFTYVVVYHLVPTSNHNTRSSNLATSPLFIILFLHQTTTRIVVALLATCCLSSCSYIKPQPYRCALVSIGGCLSSCSYIKPQPYRLLSTQLSRCLSSCSYIKPQPKN